MLVQRIKGWRNCQIETIGYLIAKPIEDEYLDNFVTFGISLCHPDDKFDKEIGIAKAMEVANTYYKDHIVKDYRVVSPVNCRDNKKKNEWMSINDFIFTFIDRCMKYYKNKNLIYPKFKITSS